ncbi:MAG: T9SS type A sorting domain-containing protein [Bacteroidota bacterium]
MKRTVSVVMMFLIALGVSMAQCTIDSTQTTPGVYPGASPLPQVGVYYNQDLTIVFPTETLGLQILSVQLNSVTGTVPGLTWTCNSPFPNCTYYPNQSIWGCINVSGIPLQAGTYTTVINVTADIQLVGSQTFDINLPSIVEPGILNNPGFEMIPDSGCSSLLSTVQNTVTGEYSYNWTFGNGHSLTLEQPGSVQYDSAGIYIVTREIVPQPGFKYYLTGITVNSIPDAYSDGIVSDVADLYLKITDTNSVHLETSLIINNQTSNVYFPIDTIQLNNENYEVQVWDDDPFIGAPDDSLGRIIFYGFSNTGNATSILAGEPGILDVTYHIYTRPISPVLDYDTVYIFNPPAPSVIVLNNDTLATPLLPNLNYQWYLNNQLLPGDTMNYIAVSGTGSYTLGITDLNNCTSVSLPWVIASVPFYASSNFTIYPNPSNGVFHLKALNSTSGVFDLALVDQQGRVLMQKQGVLFKAIESLHFNTLENGSYMLLISDKNNLSQIPLMIIH